MNEPTFNQIRSVKAEIWSYEDDQLKAIIKTLKKKLFLPAKTDVVESQTYIPIYTNGAHLIPNKLYFQFWGGGGSQV